jgi:hypothetical protein
MPHDRRRLHAPLAFLAALLAGAAPAPAADAPKAGPDAKLTVVRARASGVREGDRPVEIDPRLADYESRIRALHTRHARFAHEGTSEHDVAWGERVEVSVAGAARLGLVARPSGRSGNVLLELQEWAGAESDACLTTAVDVGPRAPAVVFCDRPDPKGTVMFFVRGTPAR